MEADIVAAGSINKVFEGQHWNRGVKAHRIGAEAFNRLRWMRFLEWIAETGEDFDMTKMIEMIQQFRENVHQDGLQALLAHCLNRQKRYLQYTYIISYRFTAILV